MTFEAEATAQGVPRDRTDDDSSASLRRAMSYYAMLSSVLHEERDESGEVM